MTVRDQVLQAIKQVGTQADPVTLNGLVAVLEADGLKRDHISPALSNLVKLNKHVHRRAVPNVDYVERKGAKRTVKGYWFDKGYTNETHRKPKLTKRAKAEPGPTEPPVLSDREQAGAGLEVREIASIELADPVYPIDKFQLGTTLSADGSPFDYPLPEGLMWTELPSGMFVVGKFHPWQRSNETPWIVLRQAPASLGCFALHYVTTSEERARAKAELCAKAIPQTSFFVMQPTAEFRYGDLQIKEIYDGDA